MSTGDLAKTAAALVENWIIQDPKMPALLLAEVQLDHFLVDGEPEFLEALSRALVIEHFAKLIRIERAKKYRAGQLSLPGFDHIPRRIVGEKDKRVNLVNATYSDIRRYAKLLSRQNRDRLREAPKLKELRALLRRMKRRSQTNRGITVGEVLGVEG